MAYGGEQTITPAGWGGAAGRKDEPDLAKLARILPLRYQISAPQQMAPADTTVETANTSKLTIPGGTLKPGDRIRVRALADTINKSGPPKVQCRIRFGGLTGVAVAASGNNTAAVGNKHWLEADIFVEAVGAALTAKFHSHGYAFVTGLSDVHTVVVDETSISTNADIDIVFTQDWDGDNVLNRVKLYELSAEVFRTRQAWG